MWFGFYNLWGEDAEVGAVKGVVGLDADIELLFSVEGRCDVVEEIPHGDFSGGEARAPSGDGLREGSGYLGASGTNDWRRRAELAGTNKLRDGMGARGH